MATHVFVLLFGILALAQANAGHNSKVRELQFWTQDDSLPGTLLTTNFGTRLNDTDNSLKAGHRGPTIFDDFHVREKNWTLRS